MLRSRLLLTSQTLTPTSPTEARRSFPKDPNEPRYCPHSSLHRESSTPSLSSPSSSLAMRRRPSTRTILSMKKRWLKRTCQYADYHRRRNASLIRLLLPYFNGNMSPVDNDKPHVYLEPPCASDVEDCESGDFSTHKEAPINSSLTSSPPRLKIDVETLPHGPWALTSTETPTMSIGYNCKGPPTNLDCQVRSAPTSIHQTALSVAAPVFSPLVSTEYPTLSSLIAERRGPPPTIPYDPDAIFGGDSDEDPYDYSDDEDDSRFGFDRSVPCFPRPLSQDQ